MFLSFFFEMRRTDFIESIYLGRNSKNFKRFVSDDQNQHLPPDSRTSRFYFAETIFPMLPPTNHRNESYKHVAGKQKALTPRSLRVRLHVLSVTRQVRRHQRKFSLYLCGCSHRGRGSILPLAPLLVLLVTKVTTTSHQ